MRHRLTLAALLTAATLTLAPLAVAASDDPTPYTVARDGLTLPRPLAAHDHVNVRLTDGRTGHMHLDPNVGHHGAPWIGKSFLPWSALGITSGCVAWVQVAGYDEHHGEGGQSPVCLDDEPSDEPSETTTPTDDPTTVEPTTDPTTDPTTPTEPTPEETTWTAEPEPSAEPTPSTPSEQPSPPTDPSPTPPVSSPEPTEPVATTSAPEPTPSASSTSPTSTPTSSSTPSRPLPVPVPDVTVHPGDWPSSVPPTIHGEHGSVDPMPSLPVTGARTVAMSALAVVALISGTVLLVLRRRGGDL